MISVIHNVFQTLGNTIFYVDPCTRTNQTKNKRNTPDTSERREWHMGSRDDDVYTLTKMYCYHSMRMPDEFSQSIARFDAGL